MILITGGTGCVGSNLAATLTAAGKQVAILRRPRADLRAISGIPVEHRIGDVLDPVSLRTAVRGCDTVFHAAALVSFAARQREEQLRVNVGGTRNVVEACLAEGVSTLLHVSSVATIGATTDGSLSSEETGYSWPATPGYRYSKYLAEQEVFRGVERGLHAIIVNPSVIVGERDYRTHGAQVIIEVKRGLTFFYIDGGMNVVYVGDVVRGMIAAAEKGRPGERYILGGENLTHREVFSRTARLIGGRAPVIRLPVPLVRAAARVIEAACGTLRIDPPISSDLFAGAGKFNWFTSAKAEHELGYTTTPFDEAIRKAYRWLVAAGVVRGGPNSEF